MRNILTLLVAFTVSSCAFVDFRDAECYGNKIAGDAPRKCGNAHFDKDSASIDSCVIKNAEINRNFYAWYWEDGIDSNPACGVALNRENDLFILSYDEWYLLFAPTFHPQKCDSWKMEYKDGKQTILCQLKNPICRYNDQMNKFLKFDDQPANKSSHSAN